MAKTIKQIESRLEQLEDQVTCGRRSLAAALAAAYSFGAKGIKVIPANRDSARYFAKQTSTCLPRK